MVKALWMRNSMLPRFLVALWDANCWPNQFLEHSRSGSLIGQQRKRLTVNRIHLWIEWSTFYIRALVSASECVAWSLVITPWSWHCASSWPCHHHHPWPGTFTGVETRQQHNQLNNLENCFEQRGWHLWLSPSLSVKQPCGWLSPINHVYYCSAEYQKTHQIASYMWPGNMPGERRGDDNTDWWDGRCDEGGMVLAASHGRCWHLIWDGSWTLTITPGLSLVTHPEILHLHWPEAPHPWWAEDSDTDRGWCGAWAQAHHMSHCYCLLFIRTTTKRACRKTI